MHSAAREGHLVLVDLLLESGATPLSMTNNGRTAMWYAAAEGQTAVLSLLLKQPHDTYVLMDDRKVFHFFKLIDKFTFRMSPQF